MSTYGKYEVIPGLVATTTMASNQYKIVRFATTAGQFALAAAVTDNVAGVLQNDPIMGGVGEIAFSGICKVLSEASVNEGDRVTCSTTSRAKSTTTDGARIVGFALAAGGAGELIPLVLHMHDSYTA